jgi:wyosine [tRNA(Phe)-imidazoG37] synthetase (radical SAM superfamily)
MSAPAPHNPAASAALQRAFAEHARTWREFVYIYPVISRRAKGLSIGVNLNPDKACNFDCVYCCVDRTAGATAPPPVRKSVDLAELRGELDRMLDLVMDGAIWQAEPFASVPAPFRRVNDIAFSGDGEPTTYRHFDQAVQLVADAKQAHRLDKVKIVLVTNATVLDRPLVQRGLTLLDMHQGEIWAKLDAGTPEYYQQIDRAKVPLAKVLRNILDCGRLRPIVIQSLFLQLHGEPPPPREVEAYLDRLHELAQQGCRIKLVQLYTVARRTAEPWATALTNRQLDELAARFRARLPELRAETYYAAR